MKSRRAGMSRKGFKLKNIFPRRIRNEGALNEGGKPQLSPGPWRSAWTPRCYLCWWNTAIAPLTHLAPVALNTSNALTLLYGRNFDLLSSISERAVLVRAGDKLRASLAWRSFFFLTGKCVKVRRVKKVSKEVALKIFLTSCSLWLSSLLTPVVERTNPLHSGCSPSLASRRDGRADIMPLPRYQQHQLVHLGIERGVLLNLLARFGLYTSWGTHSWHLCARLLAWTCVLHSITSLRLLKGFSCRKRDWKRSNEPRSIELLAQNFWYISCAVLFLESQCYPIAGPRMKIFCIRLKHPWNLQKMTGLTPMSFPAG